jgi:hypothetical protein
LTQDGTDSPPGTLPHLASFGPGPTKVDRPVTNLIRLPLDKLVSPFTMSGAVCTNLRKILEGEADGSLVRYSSYTSDPDDTFQQ